MTVVGAVAVLLGTSLASPAFGRPLLTASQAVFRRVFGAVGALAGENARRNPRRTAATASALMIGLSLACAVAILGASGKESAAVAIDETFSGDYVVGSGTGQTFSPDVARKMSQVEGVTQVMRQRYGVGTFNGKQQFLGAIDPDGLGSIVKVDVVEGSIEYVQKGVADALRATSMMSEPAHVTWVSPHPVTRPDGVDELHCALSHREFADVLSKSHVLLKLSRAEGMYGPPLEGFHRGCTVVTTPVTGHDEYVRHRENGLVTGWDDLHGTARALDLLARDRDLLDDLRRGALQTASEWPGWPEAAGRMAETLQAIAADPPPDGRGAGLRLASDIQTAIDDVEFASWRAESAMDVYKDLRGQKAVRGALKLRRMLKR